MWMGILLLTFFAVLAFLGLTGIGVHDSRDTRFSWQPEGADKL